MFEEASFVLYYQVVELAVDWDAGVVDELERVAAETVHVTPRRRDAAVPKHPNEVVRTLGTERHEVPEGVEVLKLQRKTLLFQVKKYRVSSTPARLPHRLLISDRIFFSHLGACFRCMLRKNG